jgi:hypothetical protein
MPESSGIGTCNSAHVTRLVLALPLSRSLKSVRHSEARSDALETVLEMRAGNCGHGDGL